MIVALISGGVGTQEVKVAFVVHVPYIHALSLVENHRDWCVVVSSILVLPCNELQCHSRMWLTSSSTSSTRQEDHLRSVALKKRPGQPTHTVSHSQMRLADALKALSSQYSEDGVRQRPHTGASLIDRADSPYFVLLMRFLCYNLGGGAD